MLKQIKDFYALDYLSDEDIQKAMIYASTHDCVCRIWFEGDDLDFYNKEFECIFPYDTYEMVCERLRNKLPKWRK